MEEIKETGTSFLDYISGGDIGVIGLLAYLYWFARGQIKSLWGFVKENTPKAFTAYGQYTHQVERQNDVIENDTEVLKRVVTVLERIEKRLERSDNVHQ